MDPVTIAALLGAAGSTLGGLFGGPTTQRFNRFEDDQTGGLQQLLQQGLGNFNFDDIANQARSNFSQKTLPSILERITSMGGQRSGARDRIIGGATGNLEGQLASLRPQIGAQQLAFGLQPRFETQYSPRQPGFEQFAGPLLNFAGQNYGMNQQMGQQSSQFNTLMELLRSRGGQ